MKKIDKKANKATEREMKKLALSFALQFLNHKDSSKLLPDTIEGIEDKKKLVGAVVDYQSENNSSLIGDMTSALSKTFLELIMESELDAYLGYEKHGRRGAETASEGHGDTPEAVDASSSEKGSGELPEAQEKGTGRNYRNGSYSRKVRSSQGTFDVTYPRDRNGGFNSAILPKGCKDICGLQERILQLVAEGNDLRSSARIISDLLGIDISHEYVSLTVKGYAEKLKAWQERQLKPFYPFIFIDCIYVQFRTERGGVTSRPVYVVLGIDTEGKKELLTIEMNGTAESKQDWMKIFDSMQSRGLKDVLFVCMDGVTGVAEGVKVIYPRAITQRCLVHMVRNSCKHVGYKERKEWCADTKRLYASPDLDTALAALSDLEKKWGSKIPSGVRFWKDRFNEFVAPLYELPKAVRHVVYTTNAIESLNSSLRKVVQKGCYTNTDSILTCMLLRGQGVQATNWQRKAIRNWPTIREELLSLELTRDICAQYMEVTA